MLGQNPAAVVYIEGQLRTMAVQVADLILQVGVRARRDREHDHPIEVVGRRLRERMSFLAPAAAAAARDTPKPAAMVAAGG